MQQLVSVGVKMQVKNPIESHGDKIKEYELQQLQEMDVFKLREKAPLLEDHIDALFKEQISLARGARQEFLQMLMRFKGLATKETRLLALDIQNKVPNDALPKKGQNTYACGENRNGKCGVGKVSNFVHELTAVASRTKFMTVECGFHHTLALDHN